MSQPSSSLLFFHARATYALKRNCYYRIYIAPDELLFVQAGPGKMDHLAAASGTGGGAIGWLIGSYIAGRAQKKTDARQKILDEADLDELEQLIDEDKHSFRAEFSEFSDVVIDPKSAWHQVAYSSPNHVGLLRFRHEKRGNIKLEFLNNEDLQLAIDTLPHLLPEPVAVNVVWDKTKKAFVKAP